MRLIKESLTFSDDRQKLDMSVTKLDAEDNTPIAGAVFGLYADEDIKNVDGKVIIEKGTLLEKTTSDENGKIAFVKDYPFAKYVARELVKPAGYVTNEEAVNFDTKYQGQDVKTAVYNSEYKNTPTTFEFTKTDITSGAELTGATLTVLDKDGNVVDTWTYYTLFHSDTIARNTFENYYIGSPSMQAHTGKMYIRNYEQEYYERCKELNANVYITVGGEEDSGFVSGIESFEKSLEERNYDGLNIIYEVIEGYSHDTVFKPSTIR